MPASPPEVRREERVVLFDGECVLCNSSARALIRADRSAKFKLATLQSPQGRQLLAEHGLAADSLNTFVLREQEHLFVRSTACVRVLWQLGALYKTLAAILWSIPRPLRDLGYDAIARHRYRLFGRRTSCSVPTPEDHAHLWSPTIVTGASERGFERDESQEA